MELSLRHDRVGTMSLTLRRKKNLVFATTCLQNQYKCLFKHILLISTVVRTLILQRCKHKEVRACSLKTHPGREWQSWAPGQSAQGKVLSCGLGSLPISYLRPFNSSMVREDPEELCGKAVHPHFWVMATKSSSLHRQHPQGHFLAGESTTQDGGQASRTKLCQT